MIIMGKITYSQIQEELSKADLSQLPVFNITVLRNIMLEPVEPYLRHDAYRMGYNAAISFGEYDAIYQDAVGGNAKLLHAKTDCILLFTYLENLSWKLARNFAGLDAPQVQEEIELIHARINATLSGIRRQSDAMILWHSFEVPLEPGLGIFDSQSDTGQLAVIRNLNEFLRTSLNETSNAYFVDINLCLGRIGARNFYDTRYWHLGRAPYTREALREIASEDYKFIRPLKGKNKKCLVVDCDNTLWGGIIGEDGLSGIKLGKTYPGSSYYEFQQEIVNLHHRGIIIALCSKNNEPDVWEVFRKHPDMLLKEEHIATSQINWLDKAQNLRHIAQDLNLGLDSMVFVDDSEFEIDLIRRELPEVTAIQLPKDKAVDYRNLLIACGLFDTLTISLEDRNRGNMYKAEAIRKEHQAQSSDMESYYKSLDMVVETRLADDFAVPRIAQQTQKTNQFNLTTRRYSDADIRQMMQNDASDVLYLKLSDRFGDSGIVGTCILKYDREQAVIDTFLLSCRVLGRGIEDVFLIQAMKLAKKRGCLRTIGEYYATPKNRQVEFFYSQRGFQEAELPSGDADRTFFYDLSKGLPKEHPYFKEVKSDID
jgi:FkbH-like protein